MISFVYDTNTWFLVITRPPSFKMCKFCLIYPHSDLFALLVRNSNCGWSPFVPSGTNSSTSQTPKFPAALCFSVSMPLHQRLRGSSSLLPRQLISSFFPVIFPWFLILVLPLLLSLAFIPPYMSWVFTLTLSGIFLSNLLLLIDAGMDILPQKSWFPLPNIPLFVSTCTGPLPVGVPWPCFYCFLWLCGEALCLFPIYYNQDSFQGCFNLHCLILYIFLPLFLCHTYASLPTYWRYRYFEVFIWNCLCVPYWSN